MQPTDYEAYHIPLCAYSCPFFNEIVDSQMHFFPSEGSQLIDRRYRSWGLARGTTGRHIEEHGQRLLVPLAVCLGGHCGEAGWVRRYALTHEEQR